MQLAQGLSLESKTLKRWPLGRFEDLGGGIFRAIRCKITGTLTLGLQFCPLLSSAQCFPGSSQLLLHDYTHLCPSVYLITTFESLRDSRDSNAIQTLSTFIKKKQFTLENKFVEACFLLESHGQFFFFPSVGEVIRGQQIQENSSEAPSSYSTTIRPQVDN